jgi:2OG-Fe(II) oxygenase superfamily
MLCGETDSKQTPHHVSLGEEIDHLENRRNRINGSDRFLIALSSVILGFCFAWASSGPAKVSFHCLFSLIFARESLYMLILKASISAAITTTSRFATLLLYLNDGMEGGQTSFPMWRNGETSKALEVKPEKGKAVLFYNLLPDGNYDELSMHAALPVKKGEKWLANLWVWASNNCSVDV